MRQSEPPAAVEALLQIPGLTGTYEVPKPKEPTTVAIATIIGIAGGTVTIAEQIRKWYQEWEDAQPDKRFNVVIFDPETGNRVFLNEASIEEITEILKSLS